MHFTKKMRRLLICLQTLTFNLYFFFHYKALSELMYDVRNGFNSVYKHHQKTEPLRKTLTPLPKTISTSEWLRLKIQKKKLFQE